MNRIMFRWRQRRERKRLHRDNLLERCRNFQLKNFECIFLFVRIVKLPNHRLSKCQNRFRINTSLVICWTRIRAKKFELTFGKIEKYICNKTASATAAAAIHTHTIGISSLVGWLVDSHKVLSSPKMSDDFHKLYFALPP